MKRWLVRRARHLLARCLAGPPGMRPQQHYRAVIFKVDRIGDFVLALAAIRLALQAWGEEDCLLVVSPLAVELAAAEFPRTPRLVLPPFVGHRRLLPEAIKARRQLGRISCEVALSLRHQRWDFDELALSWVRAQRAYLLEDVQRTKMFSERLTYRFAGGTRVVFQETVPSGPAEFELCRELMMHRQLLSAALAREVAAGEILPVLERGPERPDDAVIICPLGSEATRDLPPEILATVLRALRPSGRPAVLNGSASQAPRLAAMVEKLRAQGFGPVHERCDLSLPEFVSALAAAPLVVATETAAAHLATALDRPALVIIGGGHYGQFGPWRRSARQIWLTHAMDCFGCDWHCIYARPHCITDVPAEQIAASVALLLGEGKAH